MNTPRKIRIPRPLYPWNNPSGQFDDPVEQYVNRVLQDLERIKLEIATVNATGGLYGDILVADINRTFQPQKFVPLSLGVGLTANPTYRFQVQEGAVSLYFTEAVSGGAYGLTLNEAASGVSRLGYKLASGGVVLWEVGLDTGGNLLLRSHLNSANVFVSDSSGNIRLLRNVDVGRNLTVTGDTVLFGNVTTGPLVANTLQVTGSSWLFGTTRVGPLIVNTLQVTGDSWFFGNNKGGPTTLNSLQVTGATILGSLVAGAVTCNSLTVTGTATVSLLSASGIFVTVLSKAADYTLTAADTVVLAYASGGNVIMTLPTAVGIRGRIYKVKKADSSVNSVTVATTGGQTIDGSATIATTTAYVAYEVISDGNNWYLL